ncbi:putative transcription factor interactor and regulator CCHC(Zn) family [Helianthus annuus]|nr:putative transcription factor interactor and regulator CCHC(Zn) family [Helianthus annuus]KAJ0460456.1 putative transcription factor interactor and regulator CCHC(Zn) family [Helianthus annuus]
MFQVRRTVKEVPEFEIKVDTEAVKVPEKCLNCDCLIKQNNELLHNIKILKESYDTLNREINKYTESNSEQAVAMNTLKGAYMRQLDVNFYTKKCAEIYPIVEELKTFEEEKTSEEKKSVTKDEDEVKISGKTTEAEKEQAFRKQTNQEFLAKKQEELKKNVVQKKTEKRTCFQCKTVGHIAKNCPKTFKPKQEVSKKLKEKVVEKIEPPTNKSKVFENSIYEVGEYSKNVSKKKEKLNNQIWVVKKSRNSSSDESDSIKSEEP